MNNNNNLKSSFSYYNRRKIIRFLIEKCDNKLQELSIEYNIEIKCESMDHLVITCFKNLYSEDIIKDIFNQIIHNYNEETIIISNSLYSKIKKIYSNSKKQIIIEYLNSINDGSDVQVNICGIGDYFIGELSKIKTGEVSSDEESNDLATDSKFIYDTYLDINNRLKNNK